MTIWDCPLSAALFHSQSWWCASFHHSITFISVSSSIANHVSKDDDMKVFFKYMLSSASLKLNQSSRHASHSLQYKGSWLYAQCSSYRFLSTLLIRLWKEMSQPHQWCCFYHSYSCGEVLIWLQNKLSHNQSSRWVPFRHSFSAVVW